jgi:hypothetical protein
VAKTFVTVPTVEELDDLHLSVVGDHVADEGLLACCRLFDDTMLLSRRTRLSMSPIRDRYMAQGVLQLDYWMLVRKTAAQHRDNRRAFVTTNICFSSKATKIPHFRGGKPTAFQDKMTKIDQTLGLLGHGREKR